jgi:hypothetical protein
MLIPCKVCGKEFQNRQGKRAAKYCSLRCRSDDRIKRITKPCEYCGVPVTKTPSKIKGHMFCGRVCRTKFFWSNPEIRAKMIDGIRASPSLHTEARKQQLDEARKQRKFRFWKRKRQPNKGSFRKGGNTKNAHPRWVEPTQLICHNCGVQFERKPWQLRHSGVKGLFCSFKCKCTYDHTQRTGEKSPLWRGGEKTYRGRGWLQARQQVVDEQEGKCAQCSVYVGQSLPIHHIRPFREFSSAAEANQRDNLIGLCSSCHMKTEPRIKGQSALQPQAHQTL